MDELSNSSVIENDPVPVENDRVYCQQCQVPLVPPRDRFGSLDLTCPSCLHATRIPDSGTPGFHSDSDEELELLSASLEGSTDSPIFEFPPRRATNHCSIHAEREQDVFCETCRRCVCSHCISKGGKHHGHNSELLEDAFKKYTKEIRASLEPMEKQIGAVQKTLMQLDIRYKEVSDKRAAIKGSIRTTFGRLQEVLRDRETQLINKVDQMAEGKQDGLIAQRDELETNLAQLNSCLHFMEETLKPGNEENVLTMKANTMSQVKELTAPLNPAVMTPITEADITFLAPTDLIGPCQDYGEVIAVCLPDPSKCLVAGKGLKSAIVGERSTVTLNFEGKRSKEVVRVWAIEFVSETTGTSGNCTVDRKGRSQYDISYLPTIKGRHQLRIKIEGQHIRGSPFSVIVKSPVEKLGAPILAITEVDGPWGIAVNQNGEVVVIEQDIHCVTVFGANGGRLRSFGTRGSDPGHFLNPRGVAVDGEGNILVADGGNHRIQKFTYEGKFLAAVGTQGSGTLQLSYPMDVAFNPSNKRLYVADSENKRIQVLTSDLTFSGTFGMKGKALKEPCGISCDTTGKVYVVDRDNHCIQVFTAEGKFLRRIGKHGVGSGELDLPYYIATDVKGVVYISEWGNNRVSVFTSEGQFVTSFGGRGDGPGDFQWPRGLAVDDIGMVYVCDGDNNRIQTF